MKTKIIPSAIPIYIAAAVWVIFGLFGHLYELSNILLAIALSLAAFFVSRKFLPGRTVEVEDVLTAGPPAGTLVLCVACRSQANEDSLRRLRSE